jgi:hypothetical protein
MGKGWVFVLGLIIGIALGVLGPRYTQHAWARYIDENCVPTTVAKASSDGRMRATLTTKTCDYGFGFAAGFATVRVDKKDPNGWFINESLDVDLSPNVTITWEGSNVLEADVVSSEFSGSLEQHTECVTFLQKCSPPQTSPDAPRTS